MNDLKHGKGKYFYENGDVYEGDFKEGNKNGLGRFMWKNGKVFDGNWENGMMRDGSLVGNNGDQKVKFD